MSEAVACTTDQHLLGEGVRWDARRDELLRVDIMAGRVYRDRVADDGALIPVRTYQVPGTVGAIAPVQDDEGWLLAAGRGFVHLSPDGRVHPVADDVAPAATRMNDAACDPQGRFWAGTLADDHHAGGGALYRLDRNGQTELMLDGLTISNGLGWSLDGDVRRAHTEPSSVPIEDRGEDAGAVHPGQAHPLHAAARRDERGHLAIGDEPVVGDRRKRTSTPPSSGTHRRSRMSAQTSTFPRL